MVPIEVTYDTGYVPSKWLLYERLAEYEGFSNDVK
jgi:hypothetical protein